MPGVVGGIRLLLSARKLARIAVELRSEPDPLVKACRASGIGHTVEKSNNSTRMMMMKVWRDVVLKVREAHRPRRSLIELRSDFDAQTVRSIAEELRGRPRERLLVVAAIFDGVTREAAAINAGVTAHTVRAW
jgi:hypothetical protein